MKHTFAPRWAGTALLVAIVAFTTATPVSGTTIAPPDIAALSAAKTALDRAADSRPDSVTGWYVDPEAKSVVVSAHGSTKGVREWAEGVLPAAAGTVTVEHVAEAPRTYWDLISGQQITSENGARCTLGFNAHSSSGSRYIVSAGHCVAAGSSWSGVGGYIGPSAGASFPGNDYGLILVASAAAMSTPLVDRYSSGSDVTITGVATPPLGSSVCYSSPISGWRCGSVVGINQTICYPQGCVNQLIRINMCAEPGSSGAPVVTNPGSGTTVRAVGLISGGSGNCTSGGTTYVQPIAEPLSAYGLTLYTG